MAEPIRVRDGRLGIVTIVATGLLIATAGGISYARSSNSATTVQDSAVVTAPTGAAGDLNYARLTDPARTEARDQNGAVIAVFTDGSRTVRLTGATRTFTEPSFTTAQVTHNSWIRLAPSAWYDGAEAASWFAPWFQEAQTDTSPDVLAIALEYLDGAATQTDDQGIRYAGDAGFGPLSNTDPDGRSENNDFYDYLGITWKFPDGKVGEPNSDRYGDIDCSGFIRLLFGYRLGLTLRNTNTAGEGLPRRAYAIEQYGPGTIVIANQKVAATDYAKLQPGDLIFFDLDSSDGVQLDHMGMYIGMDSSGHHRFLSSRCKANGPTFGDLGGAAIIDGTGYFATKFRSTRRI